jgi:tetratricopeptide (TPR) repeat protein
MFNATALPIRFVCQNHVCAIFVETDMGGSESTRGYLVQALIAIIESLQDRSWNQLILEPDDDHEKIDIEWAGTATHRRMQVKSSNHITIAKVNSWVREIREKVPNGKIELVLLGPSAKGVQELKTKFKDTTIPPPKNLDIKGLVSEAAQELSEFLVQANIGQRTPTQRKLLVEALTTRLLQLGVDQRELAREELVSLLKGWIAEFSTPDDQEIIARNVVFYQRMQRNSYFVGRNEILTSLSNVFCCDAPIKKRTTAAVVGLGGQGKTRNESSYNAIVWINAESQSTVATDLARWAFLMKLIQSNCTSAEAVVAAKNWFLTNTDWLVVLDNIENSALINQFQFPNQNGHILATTRNPDLQAAQAKVLELGEMLPPESVAFFMKRTGRPELESVEESAVEELVRELGGLPLAMEQAAAYIVSRQTSFQSYLSSFKAKRLDLLEKTPASTGGYASTVATTWSLNFIEVKRKSRASWKLLRFFAFLDANDIPFELIVNGSKQLGGNIAQALEDFFLKLDCDVTIGFTSFTLPIAIDESLIDDLLEPLVSFSLIKKNSDDRTLSIHRLVQEVTRKSLPDRVASAYRAKLFQATANCFPIVRLETRSFAERLVRHAIKLFSDSDVSEHWDENIGTLAHRVGHCVEEMGDYQLAASIYNHAISIRKELFGDLHEDLALTINNLAVVYQKAGYSRKSEELFRKALEMRRKLLEPTNPDLAHSMTNLAIVILRLGMTSEAETLLLDAVKIFRACGEEEEQRFAVCLMKLADIRRMQGRHEEAKQILDEVEQIKNRSPYQAFDPGLARLLLDKAIIACDSNDFDNALAYVEQAEEIVLVVLGEKHSDYASCLNLKGMIQLGLRETETAYHYFEQSAKLAEELVGRNHPDYAIALVNMAHCLGTDENRFSEIEQLLLTARNIHEAALGKETLSVATANNNLAYQYLIRKRYSQAIDLYEEVLKTRIAILGEIHNDVAVVYGSIGICHFFKDIDDKNQQEIAEPYYQNAYRIYSELEFPISTDCANCLFHGWKFFEHIGKHEFAENSLKKYDDVKTQLRE